MEQDRSLGSLDLMASPRARFHLVLSCKGDDRLYCGFL